MTNQNNSPEVRASDPRPDFQVVIELLRQELAKTKDSTDRIQRKCQSISAMSKPPEPKREDEPSQCIIDDFMKIIREMSDSNAELFDIAGHLELIVGNGK